MSRAPDFWWRAGPTPASLALAPLGALYGAVTAWRMGRPGTRLPCPVICVGNLVAGGAGKTPVAIAIAELLSAQGHRPAFLSRGFGRKASAGPEVIRVDLDRHGAADTGDEPQLLAAVAPTYVARDRLAGARQALADGASVLVLDDGLQNPRLVKTLSIAVVDGASGVGNGACVPAGPLRAPLAAQWPHVDVVCVIGPGEAGASVAAMARKRDIPVWSASLVPDGGAVARLRGRRLLAFAGIGRPEKFFATLEAQNLTVAATQSFGDHHSFSDRDLVVLREEAARLDAVLVTTAKDRVRLPAVFPCETLPVTLRFDDEAAVRARLASLTRS